MEPLKTASRMSFLLLFWLKYFVHNKVIFAPECVSPAFTTQIFQYMKIIICFNQSPSKLPELDIVLETVEKNTY